MRFGKKTNIAENKKTRSCVVRLEKVLQPSHSPPLSSSGKTLPTKNTLISGSTLEAIPKQLSAMGPVKKRVQTPQQRQTANSVNMSALKSNQKSKPISKSNRTATSSQLISSATPARDNTPTPTIAAGRSRRAIKPNPKYASEDMVTPKMVRNVGVTKTASAYDSKQRKDSTSSDDFYNNNSDDDYEDSRKKTFSKHNDTDKAYKVDEKEEAIALDSDLSEIEEELSARTPRLRGRQRKAEASVTHTVPKTAYQTTNSNAKRVSSATVLPVRTAPTQLQQLRRSLASANAQRNQSLLAGSSSVAHKRKLEESVDSDESDTTSYTVARKKIMVSNLAGAKVRVPIRENSIISSSTSLNKSRMLGVQKIGSSTSSNQSLNGKPLSSSQIMERRRLMESAKSSISLPSKTIIRTSLNDNKLHQVMSGRSTKSQVPATKPTISTLAASSASYKTIVGSSDANKSRLRTSSPKPSIPSNSKNSLVSQPVASSAFSSQQQKKLPTLASKSYDKPKAASTTNTTTASTSSNYQPLKSLNIKGKQQQQNANSMKTSKSSENNAHQSAVLNDESPNSTMDDFETMPTFTIVNVNDIINKKGDVLITKSKSPKTTVIEFSESISLDEDDDEEDDGGKDKRKKVNAAPSVATNKISPLSNSRMEHNRNKSLAGPRNNNEPLKRTIATDSPALGAKPPQILNHKLGLRNNQRVTAKTTAPVITPPVAEKPAPRILNSVVAKRTQPVKPMIANLDDSADESFPLSLDEEEETEDDEGSKVFGKREKKLQSYSLDLDAEDTVSQNTETDEPPKVPPKALAPKNNSTVSTSPSSPQRKRRPPNSIATPIVVSNKKRILTPAAAKENSLAATNQQAKDAKTSPLVQQAGKPPAEKVVISRQGDKIIKKITCFETWYVINMPMEPKRQSFIRNQLDMPLIKLANNARSIRLPSNLWSCKVTLYELSAMTLAKSTLVTYTGDLTEYNINEEDRAKYQPSCVMFRRSIENRQLSRMPYDRAVIFKNKTFSTNIEGKNVRLVGAPSVINSEREIEILLEVVDALTLQSEFVENVTPQQ